MKLHTGLLIGLLAIGGIGSVAVADPGFGPGPSPIGPVIGKPARMLQHMAEFLELTDEQRASIRAIFEAAKPEIQALRQQGKANREALQALDPADPAYDATLANLAIINGELATTGTLLAVRVHTEIKSVLTDEQLAKIEEGRERRKGFIERHFHH